MSMNFKARDVIMARYNAKQATPLPPEEFVFGEIKDLRDSPIQHPKGYNTAAKAVVAGVPKIFYYNRAALADIMRDARTAVPARPLKLLSSAVGSTRNLLPSLKRYFGIDLEPEDIVDEPMAIETGLTSVKLTAAETSLSLLPGTTETFAIDGTYRKVGNELFRVQDSAFLPGAYDECKQAVWPASSNLPYPPAIVYGLDYTPIKEYLKQIVSTWPIRNEMLITQVDAGTRLAYYLRQVDGIPWVNVSTPTNIPWNMYGVSLIYNGPTKDFNGAKTDFDNVPVEQLRVRDFAREDMDNVLVIRFQGRASSIVANNIQPGAVFIHYNN